MIQAIIIYTIDRLYRPERDGDEWRVFELLQKFQSAGVRVVWVDTSLPTQGPFTGLLTFLRAWHAGEERRAILERTQRGRLEKARQGKVVSSSAAPFGYRYDPRTSTLSIHEDDAKTARLAFSLYLSERLSLVRLADQLNQLGIPSPEGRSWNFGSLGCMLRNETYAGTLWQNRWREERISSNAGQPARKKVSRRPREEWIPTHVPAIISREIFEDVQRRLEDNRRFAWRNAQHDYLLTGLLKHACGRHMGGRTSDGAPYYYCFGTNRGKAPLNSEGKPQRCRCHWVSGRALETAVWDTVTGLLRRPDLLAAEIDKLAKPAAETRESLETELRGLGKRLAALPQEEARLVEGYRRGLISDHLMRAEMEKVRQEKGACEARRERLDQQLAYLDKAALYKTGVQEFAKSVTQGLDAMNFGQRRDLLRLLVEHLVYDNHEVTIKALIPAPPADDRRLRQLPQGVKGVRYVLAVA